MKDKQKALRFVDKVYKKACAYRDKHGYRENLGYDQQNKDF